MQEINDILEQQSTKIARVVQSDRIEYQQEQLAVDNSDDSTRSVCDAETQYDISDIFQADEHSYSVRASSPTPQSATTPSINPAPELPP